MDIEHKEMIAHEFLSCIERTIERLNNEETHRPFHAALLSKEALFWSRFERSFSTSFGQRVIEQISRTAVIAGGASQAQNQKQTLVQLTAAQHSAIDEHIAKIRTGTLGRRPNWTLDLASVTLPHQVGEALDARVISDLWWVKGGVDHYMSIKTVKPNIDQAAEAKRDLLKLKLNDPSCKVFFGLYYNPYGENRADYAWGPPRGVFDFMVDKVVLIGRDYWEELGGVGFYDEVLAIANTVGAKTQVLCQDLRY
jgi:hypothetical protein